jgi:23S rRNA pseudouridine955/2504/2580 synthase
MRFIVLTPAHTRPGVDKPAALAGRRQGEAENQAAFASVVSLGVSCMFNGLSIIPDDGVGGKKSGAWVRIKYVTITTFRSARQRFGQIRRRRARGRAAELGAYGIGKRSGNGGGKPAGERYKPALEASGGFFNAHGFAFKAVGSISGMHTTSKKNVMETPDSVEDVNEAAIPKVEWLRIGPDSEGQRLDNFLFKYLKGVPKSRVYRMLREGEVRVNRKRAKPDYHLCLDDSLRIPPVRVAARPAATPPGSFAHSLLTRVIFRDDALLVIDKPAGQAVHGGSGISLGIVEQLRLELPEQRYLELAHRLDRETSGVLVLALKRSALLELHRMLRDGAMRKTYLALATGRWRDQVRNVKLALRKYLDAAGERRVAIDPEGQKAHTVFRLLRRVGDFSLLEAELKTGRTHQIRVHLAALGHAIAGDSKYGRAEHNQALKKQGLRRMFLHAARLELNHPLTGQPLVFEAPLPDDLNAFLAGLEPETA